MRRVASIPSDPLDDENTSVAHPRSPPQLTAQQKQKGRVTQNLPPTPPRTQQYSSRSQPPQQSSSRHRERPGPNSLAQSAGRQLSVLNQRQAREPGDGQSRTTRWEQPVIVRKWTHVAKICGIFYSPWISESELSRALHYEAGEGISEDNPDRGFVHLLNELGVGDHDRKDPRFLANVSLTPSKHPFRPPHLLGNEQFLLGLREFRGEIVSRLKGVAMEILGFGATPESQFRDQHFVKSEHSGFVDLLDGNKFLGTGDNYLRSDQIVMVSRFEYQHLNWTRYYMIRPSAQLSVVQHPSRS